MSYLYVIWVSYYCIIHQGWDITRLEWWCIGTRGVDIREASLQQEIIFIKSLIRADSRFAPNQWETALRCNAISHWLGASLESALSHWLGWGVWGHEVSCGGHHRLRGKTTSSGWSSVWHRSNTGLSSTQYEQIPIILGVWPFWLTPFFFRSITFWWAYG